MGKQNQTQMDSVGPSVAAQSKRPQDRRRRRELAGRHLGCALHQGRRLHKTGGGAVRVWELTNYFGQFLSPQWNTGEFRADSAESSTQDPLGLFAVGRAGLKRG